MHGYLHLLTPQHKARLEHLHEPTTRVGSFHHQHLDEAAAASKRQAEAIAETRREQEALRQLQPSSAHV